MNALRNKTKTYTQYQVNKLLEEAENDFAKQWEEKVEEIREAVFESAKVDMFSQFMSVAMATLEKFNGFNTEQTTQFYNDFVGLLNMMKNKPLGKDFTPQDTIDHIKETTDIDLDKDGKPVTKKLF